MEQKQSDQQNIPKQATIVGQHKIKPMVGEISLRIYLPLLQQLIATNKKFLINIKNEQNKNSRYHQQRFLLQYINNIMTGNFDIISAGLHTKVVQQFRQLLKQKMDNAWARLSYQQMKQYEMIAESNMKMLAKRNFNIKPTQFNGYYMFKIDLLGLFFKYNKKYSCLLKTKSIFMESLSQVFCMKKEQIYSLLYKFKQIKDNLQASFQVQFSEYIHLFYIIEIKYKLSIFYQKYGSDIFNSILNVPILYNQLKHHNYVIRFSQIAFQTPKRRTNKQQKERKCTTSTVQLSNLQI